MARDDEFEEEDVPPRRRRPRDDDDDRPARSRRRRDEDDDDDRPARKKSSTGLVVGILVGVFVLCCGGGIAGSIWLYNRAKKGVEQLQETVQGANEAQQNVQNLNQIGNAAQKHHDALGKFPRISYAKDGKPPRPLLS